MTVPASIVFALIRTDNELSRFLTFAEAERARVRFAAVFGWDDLEIIHIRSTTSRFLHVPSAATLAAD